MSDPADPKQRTIPDWQHEETPRSPEHPEGGSKTTEAPDPVGPPPPRFVLLEQASKFLKDIEIKDAPMEKKMAFLRSKGLTDEEVYRLLEIPYDKAKLEVQGEAGPEQAVRFFHCTYSSPKLTNIFSHPIPLLLKPMTRKPLHPNRPNHQNPLPP